MARTNNGPLSGTTGAVPYVYGQSRVGLGYRRWLIALALLAVCFALTLRLSLAQSELPMAPDVPTVSVSTDTTVTLAVSWSAPVNHGSAIIGYDLQYRTRSETTWTDGPQDQTGTSASITGLSTGSTYMVRVRATLASRTTPTTMLQRGFMTISGTLSASALAQRRVCSSFQKY